MWTSPTSTRHVREAEQDVPDEQALPAFLEPPATSYENVKIGICQVQWKVNSL